MDKDPIWIAIYAAEYVRRLAGVNSNDPEAAVRYSKDLADNHAQYWQQTWQPKAGKWVWFDNVAVRFYSNGRRAARITRSHWIVWDPDGNTLDCGTDPREATAVLQRHDLL